MDMAKYTLADGVYRNGIVAGLRGEEANANARLMLVGGAATQLYTNKPKLLRPTTDIDIIPSRPFNKKDMRVWGDYVVTIVESFQHMAENKKSRFGQEVSLIDLDNPLLIHLDRYGPNFYDRHSKKIDGEFERANCGEVDGYETRMQRAEDVIANKLRRLTFMKRKGLLNEEEKVVFELLCGGSFDDVDLADLSGTLNDIVKTRKQNLEDIGRLSYAQMVAEVDRYKARKDLYDIFSIINSQREGNFDLDKTVFLEAVKLSLEP